MSVISGAGVLAGELAAVRGELVRVDGKCGTLAALAGWAAAYAAGQAGHGTPAARVAEVAAAVAFSSAVLIVLLFVLRPRLGTTAFCRWAALSAEEITRHAREPGDLSASSVTGQGQMAGEDAAETLHVLSVITVTKYRRLRLAVDMAAAGVILLAAAAVVAW